MRDSLSQPLACTCRTRTARARRAKEMGRRAVLRLTHGLLSSTCWAWAEHVAETVTRRQEVLRRTGARLANRTLVLTIEAWRALAADSVSRREGLWHKAAAMLRGRVAGLALYGWIEYVQRSKQVLRKAAYAIGPGYSLSLGFRTWHAAVREGLRDSWRARPELFGWNLLPVKRLGLQAASGSTPFDGLFLGLSLFVIASALILTSLLFRLGLDQRAQQLGLLAALGFPGGKTVRLWSVEVLLLGSCGAVLGALAGIG
jgi:hypothetical protein